MRRDVLDELRRENPVPEAPAPAPVERLLARLDQEPLPDSRPEALRRPGWRRVRVAVPLLASVGVTVAIAVGAFVLLRGAGKPAPVAKAPGGTIQHLVDILGVLRRPQTPADRALPDRSEGGRAAALSAAITAAHSGTPVLRLARLATVAPWGQKLSSSTQ